MQVGPNRDSTDFKDQPLDLRTLPSMGRDAQGRTTDRRGIPFLKNPGPLRPEEQKRIKYRGQVFARTFNMTDPEDVKDYVLVRQSIADHKALLVCPVRSQYEPQLKGWQLLVEWMVLSAYIPQRTMPREATAR